MPWGGVKKKRRAPVSKRGREGIRYRGGAGSSLKNCTVQNLPDGAAARQDISALGSTGGFELWAISVLPSKLRPFV